MQIQLKKNHEKLKGAYKNDTLEKITSSCGAERKRSEKEQQQE